MNQIDTILTLIAQKHLGIDTLQTRHADSQASKWALRCPHPRKRTSPATDRKPTKPSAINDQKALGFTTTQRVHHIVTHHLQRSSK